MKQQNKLNVAGHRVMAALALSAVIFCAGCGNGSSKPPINLSKELTSTPITVGLAPDPATATQADLVVWANDLWGANEQCQSRLARIDTLVRKYPICQAAAPGTK